MSNDNKDKTTYYYVADKKIKLKREPTVKLVKYKNNSPTARTNLSLDARELLPVSDTVEHIKKYDAFIMKNEEDRSTSSDVIFKDLEKIVTKEDNIDFVSMAYQQENNPDLLFTTRDLVARFKDDVSKKEIDDILSKYNIKILNQEKWEPNLFHLQAPDADGVNGPVSLGNVLMESGLCKYAKASFIREKHIRVAVESREDTYLSSQWHLEVTKSIDAWEISRGNPDINICIADTGVDYAHPEFSGKIVYGYDYENDVADGTPKIPIMDDHGTACAGVAVAAGIKASGAAPLCSLIAIRTPSRLADIDEARMFVEAADRGADIISCSWGPPDGRGSQDPVPPETEEALKYCVTNGRNGKGCCIFWAAGNGNESVDDDGYAACKYVMAIAASTNPDGEGKEGRSPYSDKGKALLVCAPSNGGSKGILTTDRTGSLGYNPRKSSRPDLAGNYTDIFGGTSSATPLVAGIVGLMLSVNPDLTVSQVREILCRTAVKIGDQSSYSPIGSNGLTHSELFGYGRVNAFEAVKEAKKLSNPQRNLISQADNSIKRNVLLRNSMMRQLDEESMWI